MIDFKEIPNGETWEQFARDFLESFGFFIESPPDRGADRGKDLLVTEEVKGKLHRYKFRWLVSCKNFAHSNKAVTEEHEKSLLERVKSFNADGFIGFYSTIPSANLNHRLLDLKKNLLIKDYKLFDQTLIENLLLTAGYSHLLLQYFPESYKRVKAIHKLFDEYEPLKCDYCGKDLLEKSFTKKYASVLVEVTKKTEDDKNYIYDVYCACKRECDRKLELRYKAQGYITKWEDIEDLFIPPEYLRFIFATMNRIKDGTDIYSNEAYQKLKSILIKIGQKVLRYTTEEELKRFKELRIMDFL
jgi:hypothetical protein